jgi:hypothetical protein
MFLDSKTCCGIQCSVPFMNEGICLSAELKVPEIGKRLLEHALKTNTTSACGD